MRETAKDFGAGVDPGKFLPGLNGRNACAIQELFYFLPQDSLQKEAACFVIGILKIGNVKELGVVELGI